MNKKIQLIVGNCTKNGNSYGGEDIHKQYDSVSLAEEAGNHHRINGKSVIIRPMYNEMDEENNIAFFREWRSFNGGPFVECRWNLPELL